MWTATANKTFTDPQTGEEIMYSFSASAATEEEATYLVLIYISMVEYGTEADAWQPGDIPFPREMLYLYIQKNTLQVQEELYPDIVLTSYQSGYAYVQSYVGAMFNIDEMLELNDQTSTGYTLRVALCIATVLFILGSSPQYSDVLQGHEERLKCLLKGLKTGSRNFGKNAIAANPDVRGNVITIARPSNRP